MRNQVFAVLASITAVGALACAPAATGFEKLDVPGIENFSRMDGTPAFAGSPVGFGGATQATAMSWLHGEGFATVINLRLATEEDVDVDGSRTAAEAAGLKYIHLPLDPGNPNPDVVNAFLIAAGDKANQPVYIHCNSATRVAALWMIGRVLEDGWGIGAASKEARVIAGSPVESIAFATKYVKSHGK
jgi:uncharacterized protein (TIGR01244 family)